VIIQNYYAGQLRLPPAGGNIGHTSSDHDSIINLTLLFRTQKWCYYSISSILGRVRGSEEDNWGSSPWFRSKPAILVSSG
jgi:hypothetical protein